MIHPKPILLLLTLGLAVHSAYGSEYTINDHGLIIAVDEVAIDFDKVGVLTYDHTLSEEETKAVKAALAHHPLYRDRKLGIVSAKKINDGILLVLNEEGVADGGVDLVFSTVTNTIIGRYKGGERG